MKNIQQKADQLIQEDVHWLRRKAAETLSWGGAKEYSELTDILLDVATLYDYTQEELYGSALLERLYQHAFLLNKHTKEEAIRYARKEHELANEAKKIFFPEEIEK